MATAKKTRAPRKQKTAADLAELIRTTELALQKAKQEQAYLAVADKIKSSALVAEFRSLYAQLGGAITEVGLLAAVGKELGIKRLNVTQLEPVKRAPKGLGLAAAAKKAAASRKKST